VRPQPSGDGGPRGDWRAVVTQSPAADIRRALADDTLPSLGRGCRSHAIMVSWQLSQRCHEGAPMVNPERQMPGHVAGAYRDALDNILFLKRQQWLATNYVLLLYVAIFVISARFFSRGPTLHEIGLAHLQLRRLLSTGGCCTRFKAQSRSSEIGWLGFTGPISAKMRDWVWGWNQGRPIGISPRFTFVC
jgi:hypothetical protein